MNGTACDRTQLGSVPEFARDTEILATAHQGIALAGLCRGRDA